MARSLGGCLVAAATVPLVAAFLPFSNPPWLPTYNLSLSTITMACNNSGYYDPALASRFGIPSFDCERTPTLLRGDQLRAPVARIATGAARVVQRSTP